MTESRVSHGSRVSKDGQHLSAATRVQQPQRAVEAGQGDPFAVRVKDEGAALMRVALLVDLEFARRRLPDFDDPVEA